MAESEFRKELEHLINYHSMENGSNTPDFMLAEYLTAQLKLWDQYVKRREEWYGRGSRSMNDGGTIQATSEAQARPSSGRDQ